MVHLLFLQQCMILKNSDQTSQSLLMKMHLHEKEEKKEEEKIEQMVNDT